MNKFKMFCAVALLNISGSVQADQTEVLMQLCENMGEFAENVMSARHRGVPMMQLIRVVQQDPNLAEIGQSIVIAAYQQPAMSTPQNQLRQRREFRNAVETACVTEFINK